VQIAALAMQCAPLAGRIVAAIGISLALPAQGTPFRVADLNTSAATTYDYGTLRTGKLVGSFAIFLADDGQETRVWRTDGTSAGTSLLLRIPGAHPSGDEIEIVGGNGRAYFVGPDLGSGKQLWTSDGTTNGTLLVGNGGRTPMSLAIDLATSFCWFSATDSANGRELWRSGGTVATTTRVTQLRAGSLDGMLAEPRQVAPLPSGVFFAGQNSTSGVELWRINGIAQSLFANLASGAASSMPRQFTWSGDYLMFAADGQNGTEPYCVAQGVLQSLDLVPGATSSFPDDFVVYQPALTQPLFWGAADTPSDGRELFRYNPFSQSVTVVDLLPGGSSSAVPLLQFGTRIAYVIYGFLGGLEYSAIPGSGSTSTSLLTSFNQAGPVSRLTSSPGRILMRVENPFNTYTLYRSDGTAAGTVPIESNSPEYRVITEFPGNLGALLADGRAVYATGGPVPLVPAGVNNGANPDRLTAMPGNVVLFCTGNVPMRSDGTPAGTQPVSASLAFQTGPFSPVFAGHRYFVAGPTPRLHRTDGSAFGAVALPGTLANGTTVAWAVTPTQLLLFCGNNLYATDGVQAPVLVHSGLPAYPAPANLGNLVLFRGLAAATGVELWRTDGTASGTTLVRDTRVGSASGLGTGTEAQWSLRALPGQLLFAADDGLGDEVWRTDGTPAGTGLVTAIAPGPAAALISFGPTTADGRLLFAATSPTTGRDLWSTNGTFAGTQLLTDDATGNAVHNLGFVAGQWLFSIGDASSARLYGTTGTAATTTLVANLVGGSVATGTTVATYGGSLAGITLFSVGSSIYRSDGTGFNTFALGQAPTLSEGDQWYTQPGADIAVFGGSSVGFGREPWRSNGFPAGTARLLDIHPGNASSDPADFTAAGELVFFTADDGSTGRELWAMPTFPAVFAYGQGCPGTGGLVPQIRADAPARLGTSLQLELTQALPSAIALRSLGLAGLDLPLGNGCSVLVDAVVTDAAITSPLGTLQLNTLIPNDAALVGLSVFGQFAVLDGNGAFANFLSLSGGLQALVGH
jgi:ELWxxDGT repeat protein